MTAPDALKERARTLAAYALRDARAGDYAAASKTVRELNAELGPQGTMIAIAGWCDTLAAHCGISEGSGPLALGWKDTETGRLHLGAEGVPDRIRWAGQLIVARAALDKPMFDALIMALPEDKTVAGSYVGAVLETVAITMNGLPENEPGRAARTQEEP
jgi:hypothetical protein